MTVMPTKSTKFKVLICIFFSLLIFGIVLSINNFTNMNTAISKNYGRYNINVEDNNSRINFLEQFNIKVKPEPIETSEIKIPTQFNKVYENYNKIQKENGLNLEKYKGKTCIKYTYSVLNYKDRPDGVLANIFVFENKVIAGDICSLEIDGFMHGFVPIIETEKEKPEITYRINRTSAVNSKLNNNVG